MGNKTPPLVIPVVIDSSGVNKGLNNVNNRLRQGVAGGAASSGGFGSAGAAAAAGLAAGAAVGVFSPSAQAYRESLPFARQGMGRFRGGGLGSSTYRNLRGEAQKAFTIYAGEDQLTPEQSRANVAELYRERAAKRALQRHETIRRNRMALSRYRRAERSTISATGDFLGDVFSSDALGALKKGSAMALAAGAAAYGAYANLGQRISNIDNLVGSRAYGRMRGAQLRAFDQGPQPSALQNFMLGGMAASGNKQTMFEKDAASFQKGFGNMMSAAGLGYEIVRRDPGMAIELFIAATPMGRLFGLDFKQMMKTEIQYLNWKAAQK